MFCVADIITLMVFGCVCLLVVVCVDYLWMIIFFLGLVLFGCCCLGLRCLILLRLVGVMGISFLLVIYSCILSVLT